GKGSLFVKSGAVSCRRTVTVSGSQDLVIIETGAAEDILYTKLTSAKQTNIYSAFRQLATGQYSQARATLQIVAPFDTLAESEAAAVISSLSYLREKNYQDAENAINTYKSSSVLSAVVYGSAAISNKKTLTEFASVRSVISPLLPAALYFSDGYGLGITNTAAHTVYAISAYYSGSDASAREHLQKLEELLSRESTEAWTLSTAMQVKTVLDEI
ncbi:MAG: hypothetical protein PHQ23_13240, partial [Candidatus Wallbacteria bacterium]|nr:hypothetical protein [Candidatus Wallbacteria bacterium]